MNGEITFTICSATFVYLTQRNAVWLKNVPVAQLTVLSTYGTLYEELFPKPFNFGQERFSSLNVFSYISTKMCV